MNLQQLVQAIKDISSRSQDLNQLLQQLKVSEESLIQQRDQLLFVLAELDPARDSLGYLYLLYAAGTQGLPEHGNEAYFHTAANFLVECSNKEINLAPEKFVSLCRQVKEHARAIGNTHWAILPLRHGLQKLAPSPEHLTPIHAEYVLSCLQSKQYNAAIPILNQPVYDIDPAKTGMTTRDLLLYCMYGGMIYTGRRKYPEALQIFVQGLTVPSYAVNAITIATYKKYALVSLIHNGHVATLPKFTPSAVTRSIKSDAQAYTDLATAYSSKKPQDLPALVEKHQALFSEDGNMGLVNLVLAAKTKRAIQKLTQTFLTLSLADIAQQVGLESAAEAEGHILRMVDAGEIFAEINASAGMVRFLEDPEQFTSPHAVDRLNDTIQACSALAQKLQAINAQVSLDPAYASKIYAKDRVDRFQEDPSDLDAEPQSLAYAFQDG